MCWEILAPFLALAVTLIITQSVVILTGLLRIHDFRRFENMNSGDLARQFPIETKDSSPAEDLRKALKPLVDAEHGATNAAQTAYHNAVAQSAACLMLAFLALLLSSYSDQVRLLTAWPEESLHTLELVLTWIDTFAIVFVLLLFWRGRTATRRWIAARALTELLRQYQFLIVVFPSVVRADDPKAQFAAEAYQIKENVQKGPQADIALRITRFWSERKAKFGGHPIAAAEVSSDALLIYLKRRVLSQLGWFADSQARLTHIAERRALLLLVLYVIAVGLVSVKLVLFLWSGRTSPYLLASLLVATGLSAATTAYYISQNVRSLIHRYYTQRRQIAQWLETFNSRWKFADLPSRPLDATEKDDIRTSILDFEGLMTEELIDWVHISSYDAIEVGP